MKANHQSSIKHYFIEFGLSMVAYVITLTSVLTLRPAGAAEQGLYWPGLLPAIPLFFAFWAIIRQYKRSDEFYQRLHAESFALGAMILGLFCVVWGFAEISGAPEIPTIFYGPAMVALWGLCIPVVRSRY